MNISKLNLLVVTGTEFSGKSTVVRLLEEARPDQFVRLIPFTTAPVESEAILRVSDAVFADMEERNQFAYTWQDGNYRSGYTEASFQNRKDTCILLEMNPDQINHLRDFMCMRRVGIVWLNISSAEIEKRYKEHHAGKSVVNAEKEINDLLFINTRSNITFHQAYCRADANNEPFLYFEQDVPTKEIARKILE
jgi:guanylate kinase